MADNTIEVRISSPTQKPNELDLNVKSVFGTYCMDERKFIDQGLVVARHESKCPVWGDVVPFKSATLICSEEQYDSVVFWCEYVQGADSISRERTLDDGRIALRADYMCW